MRGALMADDITLMANGDKEIAANSLCNKYYLFNYSLFMSRDKLFV